MIYKIVWGNEKHKEGEEIELKWAFLDAAYNESLRHRGTMIDLIIERTGVTRGDASRIVGEYFEQFG